MKTIYIEITWDDGDKGMTAEDVKNDIEQMLNQKSYFPDTIEVE